MPHSSNLSPAQVFKVEDLVRMGEGGKRVLYEHPEDPSKLIKVTKPRDPITENGLFDRLADVLDFDTRQRAISKEIKEYERVVALERRGFGVSPIAHMYGYAATDRGPALVVEKIASHDGNIAQSLRQILSRRTLDLNEHKALNIFAKNLLEFDVRASDLTAANIVLGHRFTDNPNPPLEAVLVDGYGDTHLLPVRSWSRHLNALSNHRRLHRIAQFLGLQWNEQTRLFSLFQG